jgi:hypothetical protein
MSLDVSLMKNNSYVFDANITHNLNVMADKAGLYNALWNPFDSGYHTASQLVEPLTSGLGKLLIDKSYYERFDASNGWGRYKHLLDFISKYLEACLLYPDAEIRISK